MDQDIGSSVIMHILANTPALYAWGLKPTTAIFRTTYTYENGRTGDTIIFSGKKYKYSLIIKINIVFTYHSNKTFFEHCVSIRWAPSVTCAK